MLPASLQNLINEFTKLPGIGPRQAARFAFYLLKNESDLDVLINTLTITKETARLCGECFLPAEIVQADAIPFCAICQDPRRNKNLICFVEKEADALNFEKTGYFRGKYYILGEFIDPLRPVSISKQRLELFLNRLTNSSKDSQFEILLAFTPRKEGDFTSLYIEDKLRTLQSMGFKIKTTRLGRGLSSGAELEYADHETIRNALEGRR